MKVTFERDISIDDFLEEYWDDGATDNGWYALLEGCSSIVGAVHDKIQEGIKGHDALTLQEYEKKVLAPLRLAMAGLRDID